MRILVASLLVMILTGCTTTSRSSHSQDQSTRAYPSLIIHPSEIEPSVGILKRRASPPVAQCAVIRHTVRAGETLWAISKLYKVDVAALAGANSLSDSKSIEVGQILIIPGASLKAVPKKVN